MCCHRPGISAWAHSRDKADPKPWARTALAGAKWNRRWFGRAIPVHAAFNPQVFRSQGYAPCLAG